jgi:hypothetical protein
MPPLAAGPRLDWVFLHLDASGTCSISRSMELLNEHRQRELLAQPESGMGYQTVDVVLRDGESLRGTAFNSEYLLYSGEPVERLERITEPSRRLMLLERKELGLGERIVQLKVIPTEATTPGRVREGSDPQTTSLSSGGASEAPEEELEEEEEFKRFSAFADDHRITSTGGLVPGSYATTAADAKHVKTGSDAVRRYALPNPMPAVNEFTVKPPMKITTLKRGVAQPAYGRPGGGMEAIFVNGSPQQTVTGPKQIPP